MNDKEILTLKFQKSPLIPDEHFERSRKVAERQMAIELFDKIKEGEWFTVKIERTSPYSFYLQECNYPEPLSDYYETKVYVGKVIPVEYKYVPPENLNLKERLIALFTGKIPSRIMVTR